MNEQQVPPAAIGNARVLVLGRSPEVMEIVLRELVALGIATQGSTEPEDAPEQFDGARFDLIAFGRDVSGSTAEQLRRAFARQNPRLRFLHITAQLAAWQIARTLDEAKPEALVDLDAYCARIGYRGPLRPTIETLRALCELHPAAIPFEAIDVLLHRRIDLSPQAVDAKLIAGGRGGYCFEQNLLFKRVLTTIGFPVEGLVGRILWTVPPGSPPRPRTHMALRVIVDGVPYLADVGFGAAVPTAPLRMDTTDAQPTRHAPYRVVRFGAPWRVQIRERDEWLSMYDLSDEPQLDLDYDMANWFTSTHPASHFRHELMVARSTKDARHTLLNGRLTIRRPNGESERRILDADGIEHALRGIFGLPVEQDWRPALTRVAQLTQE